MSLVNDIGRMEKYQEGNLHQMWMFKNSRLQHVQRANWLAVASDQNRLVLGCEENGEQKCTWVMEPFKGPQVVTHHMTSNYSSMMEKVRKVTEQGACAAPPPPGSDLHVILQESLEKVGRTDNLCLSAVMQ